MGFESCHPAVNFLFFSAALYGAAAFSHPIFLAVGLLCAFANAVRRGGRRAVVFALWLFPSAAVFALCYACFHHFGVTVLVHNFIGNRLTLESLLYGLNLGLRGMAVCLWLRCMFDVLSSDKVIYLFGTLDPRLALCLTVLLRFFPRLHLQARRIGLARQGIGCGTAQGSFFRRCGNALRIFSMLISWAIGAFATASDSMRSRGVTLRGRTAFSLYRFDARDRALVIAMFCGIILAAMGVILGATELRFSPAIAWRDPTPLALVTAAGYAVFCLIPLIVAHLTQRRII